MTTAADLADAIDPRLRLFPQHHRVKRETLIAASDLLRTLPHHGGELAGEFERLAKAAHAFLTSAPGSSSDDLEAFESFCFNHRAEISSALSGKVKP
jgi:hypothetical protein